MKITTKHLLCINIILLWLFVHASSQDVHDTGDLYPDKTAMDTINTDFSTWLEQCLGCKNKKSTSEEQINQRKEVQTDLEDKLINKILPEFRAELADKESIDNFIIKNVDDYAEEKEHNSSNNNNFGSAYAQRDKKSSDSEVTQLATESSGMWFGPRLGRREKKSSNLAPESSDMWFGPRLGRREKKSSDLAPESSGMWFGPRLGRREKKSSDLAPESSGMWFGPRLGRREKKSSDLAPEGSGMWFGPRLGKREKKSINLVPESSGMWFGPRLGRREKKSSDLAPEGSGMWFGPRLGRREKKSSLAPESRGMWFGPRLGRREKKSSSLAPESSGMWFGPRLGRREKKSSSDMWFGPRLGRREKKSNYDNGQPTISGKWFERRLGHNEKSFLGKFPFWTVLESEYYKLPLDYAQRLGPDTPNKIDPKVADTIRLDSQNFISDLDEKEKIIDENATSSGTLLELDPHQRQRKFLNIIDNKLHGTHIWNLLANGDDKPSKYDFTPRLGRDLYDDEIATLAKIIRSLPRRQKTERKYEHFTPRLG